MSRSSRHLALLAAVTVAAIVASACGSDAPSPSPSPSVAASTSPPVAASATAAASISPGPGATVSPSASVAPPPSAVACVVKPEDGQLPSDRVVSVKVSTTPTVDFVTFVFDDGSLSPAGPPRGELTAAEPPFTYGPSGLPIDLQGQHALQVRMSGMSLYNDVGEPIFLGDRDIQANFPALKQVILYDESEGIAAWYIGYDGNGCVGLVRDGNDITVTIAHS